MDLLAKPLNPNKHLKEEFVSNLTGSSMTEIVILSLIVPALVVLRQWSCFGSKTDLANIKNVVGKTHGATTSKYKDLLTFAIILTKDFILVILPIILVFTVLAEWAYILAIILSIMLLFCISNKRSLSPSDNNVGPQHLSSSRMNILSYRVSMVVITCICILAVDFEIFPRRYAKTETYGTSLMDLGVGSFVVANSLVSRQARGVMSVSSHLYSRCRLSGSCWGIWCSLEFLFHPSSCLFTNFYNPYPSQVLWNIRLSYSHRHIYCFWNHLFQFLELYDIDSDGILFFTAYQMSLKYGLNGYLLSNNRALDIISQNKEGLFSIFGYWGLYLIGLHLGYNIFFVKATSTNAGSNQHTSSVWILCIMFWLLTIILDRYVEKVSRRMCNLAYVTLVLAQNLQVLSVLMLSDAISGQRPLLLEEVFNQNLLGSFLLANVLTGMVNLGIDTLSASSFAAFVILVGYALCLTGVVSFAWFYNIKLKFW